jgi:hypothetical protein
MTRISRLVFAAALLGAAACSSPTAPSATKKPTPSATPLMECVGGWDTQSGTPCG